MSRKAPLFELLLIPVIMWMNNTLYRCKPVLESFSDGTNKNNLIVFLFLTVCFTLSTRKVPAQSWGVFDTDVLSVTVFSPSGRQEKALASGVALGTRLPDQAQLLRKLQKEQSSGFFLLRTLARKFGPYFLTGTLCIIFHDAFMFAIPQVLRWDMQEQTSKSTPPWVQFSSKYAEWFSYAWRQKSDTSAFLQNVLNETLHQMAIISNGVIQFRKRCSCCVFQI